jgi:hypothetical protein
MERDHNHDSGSRRPSHCSNARNDQTALTLVLYTKQSDDSPGILASARLPARRRSDVLNKIMQHRTVLGRRMKEYAMFDELAGRINATTLRLKQAHAILNLFETDFGRPAVTLEEIKEWAYAQEDEQLRSRVDQLLSN